MQSDTLHSIQNEASNTDLPQQLFYFPFLIQVSEFSTKHRCMLQVTSEKERLGFLVKYGNVLRNILVNDYSNLTSKGKQICACVIIRN